MSEILQRLAQGVIARPGGTSTPTAAGEVRPRPASPFVPPAAEGPPGFAAPGPLPGSWAAYGNPPLGARHGSGSAADRPPGQPQGTAGRDDHGEGLPRIPAARPRTTPTSPKPGRRGDGRGAGDGPVSGGGIDGSGAGDGGVIDGGVAPRAVRPSAGQPPPDSGVQPTGARTGGDGAVRASNPLVEAADREAQAAWTSHEAADRSDLRVGPPPADVTPATAVPATAVPATATPATGAVRPRALLPRPLPPDGHAVRDDVIETRRSGRADATPTEVHVHIGRVEVTAIRGEPPVSVGRGERRDRRPPDPTPLEAHLARRREVRP